MKLHLSKSEMDMFLSVSSSDRAIGNTIKAIPYKTSKTPFQEHGLNETIVVIIFCLLALSVYMFLRKKGLTQHVFIKEKKIKIIERTKVTSRSSILLVQYNNRSFLMSQSLDTLSLISEVDADLK